nr:hypothetical protein CFP56_34617 [Quercus suber]
MEEHRLIQDITLKRTQHQNYSCPSLHISNDTTQETTVSTARVTPPTNSLHTKREEYNRETKCNLKTSTSIYDLVRRNLLESKLFFFIP